MIRRPLPCSSSFTRADDQEAFGKEEEQGSGRRIIYQLTMCVKALLSLLIFMPRIVINCILLWLGCRWLLATTSFSDLLLNAVALTFVLDLGQIFYHAAVPERNK